MGEGKKKLHIGHLGYPDIKKSIRDTNQNHSTQNMSHRYGTLGSPTCQSSVQGQVGQMYEKLLGMVGTGLTPLCGESLALLNTSLSSYQKPARLGLVRSVNMYRMKLFWKGTPEKTFPKTVSSGLEPRCWQNWSTRTPRGLHALLQAGDF